MIDNNHVCGRSGTEVRHGDGVVEELDRDALERLMKQAVGVGSQIIATSLEPDALEFPREPTRFHVEHGVLARATR